MERWSNIDKRDPLAIVMPATEEDIVKTVKLAIDQSVPFVAKSGGHGSWSCIGSDGFILDLSLLRGVKVDKERQVATIEAGARIKDVHQATTAAGFCGGFGSGNTVGAVPSTVGGGLTVLVPLVGFGSDNVVSARMITATGELITISEIENKELLYALKGAGQFFGVVASLTIKVHPLSILNTPNNTCFFATLMFDVSRASEALGTLIPVQKATKRSAGLCLIGCPPPMFTPVVMIAYFYLGTTEDAEKELKPLLDLKPEMYQGADVPFENINDSMDIYCSKGDFKYWAGAGLQGIDKEDILHMLEMYKELVEKCPDAKATAWGIEWCAKGPWHREEMMDETAFPHRDVTNWIEHLNWFTTPDSEATVRQMSKDAIAYMRRHQAPDKYSVYQNWTRTDPIGWRYRGADRLKKLKALKQKWDPTGVFTKTFL